MATTVYLVRHGETMGNRLGRFQTYATPLSDVGQAQAQRVAERLAGEGPFGALYASDLARTMETATAIGARLGLTPTATAALRELDVGDWKGVPREEIEERHPGALEQWVLGGGATRLPGSEGESVADVAERAIAFFDEAVLRHAGERIIFVSHGWTLAILLSHIHGWEQAEAFSERRIQLGNTAVSVVEVDEAVAARCVLLGCVAHLDAETPAAPQRAV